MKKPASCAACPMFQTGQGFVPDDVRSTSPKVTVWLQNPGQTEEQKAVPACGTTGDILNKELLPAAGLTRADVNVSNVLRCRLNGSNEMPKGKVLEEAVQACRSNDGPLPAFTLALGAHAWRLFDGPGNITDWRGYRHPDRPTVFGSLHPADLLRNPKMRLALLADMKKFRRFMNGEWPEKVPPYAVVSKVDQIGLLRAWADEAQARASFVALDTEFTRGPSPWLTLLGLHFPGETRGVQVEVNHFGGAPRNWVGDILKDVVARVPIVFQNAMADLPVIERNLRVPPSAFLQVHDTMLAHALLWSDWPHDLEFLASIYGRHDKMKHLAATDPNLYNWGDCVETANVWHGVAAELGRDPASKSVYTLQSIPLVPVILKRAKVGIRVNKPRVEEVNETLTKAVDAANQIVRAAVGREINLGSPKQLSEYLYAPGRYAKPKGKNVSAMGVDGDSIAMLRMKVAPFDADEEKHEALNPKYYVDRIIAYDADPVLEARALYAGAQQILAHYIRPLLSVDRVYPQMKIHAQASGRWSTTDPPLAQLPNDLRDIIMPDEGEVWLAWDWDQIELRLLAALAKDKPYLTAFDNGYDIHTINACDLFGLPKPTDLMDPHKSADAEEWRTGVNWQGKDDPRRVFAKRFVYRLNYGGEPRTAGDIPGAKQLGLTANKLVMAAQRYLQAHPDLGQWRASVASAASQHRRSRTFMGRLRRLLVSGQAAIREAYNHPMQGGVSDILNSVTVRIARELPEATLVYTMHDSATWAVPEAHERTAFSAIRNILDEPYKVDGVDLYVPATFKPPVRGAHA